VEHKDQHRVGGEANVAENEGLGSRIYSRLTDTPLVSPWTPGTGGPASILRFGMDRFALTDSIHRRWAGGSSSASDRASFQHVNFSEARQKTIQKKSVARENLAKPTVSVGAAGPERSGSGNGEVAPQTERIEAHDELARDAVATTFAGSITPRLQASPAAPVEGTGAGFSAAVTGANYSTDGVVYPGARSDETRGHALPGMIPAAATTPVRDVLHAKLVHSNDANRVRLKSSSSVTGAGDSAERVVSPSTHADETRSHVPHSPIPPSATAPTPEVLRTKALPADVLQANNDSRVMRKSPSTDGAAWGPIIRQRSRGQIQQKRESAAPSSSVPAGPKSSETGVPEIQTPAAQGDSGRSSLPGSEHSAKIGSANPATVSVPPARALPAPRMDGAIVSRHRETPVPVLQRAATVVRPSQQSAIANPFNETADRTAPPQSSLLSRSTASEPDAAAGVSGEPSRVMRSQETHLLAAKTDSEHRSDADAKDPEKGHSATAVSALEPLMKALPAPDLGGAIVSRYAATPVTVLQKASAFVPLTQESAIASHLRKTADTPTKPVSTPSASGAAGGDHSSTVLRKENRAEITSDARLLPEKANHALAAAPAQPSADTKEPQLQSPIGSPASGESSASASPVAPSPASLGASSDYGAARLSHPTASSVSSSRESGHQRDAGAGDLGTSIMHRYHNSARSMDVPSANMQSTIHRSLQSRDATVIQRSTAGFPAAGPNSLTRGASATIVVQPEITRHDSASHIDGTELHGTELLRQASDPSSSEGNSGTAPGAVLTAANVPQNLDIPQPASLTPILNPVARSFTHDTVHLNNAGGRLRRMANDPPDRGRATGGVTPLAQTTMAQTIMEQGALALTHRTTPGFNSTSIVPSGLQPGTSSPEFSGRLQRVAADAGATAATQSVSLPAQSSASSTLGSPDVANLANRVYDLLVRRLANERQSRGL